MVFVLLSAVSCYCFADGAGQGPASAATGLRIYLPREVLVAGESISLGLVGVVRGEDALAAKASEVGLGRFSLAGQQIVIDKSTILSRLASSGIKGAQVTLSGAERVTVKRNEKIISGDRFVELARGYLREQLSNVSVSGIEATRKPSDWVMPGNGEIKLVPRMARYNTRTPTKVWVSVIRDGVEVDGREIVFSLRYRRRQAVAQVDITEGVMIGSDNVRIETVESLSPNPPGWMAPYGMVARRRIRKDSVISETMVGPVEQPVLIERNQMVVIKIEKPGMTVSAIGEALGDGKVGDYIKVKRGLQRDAPIIVGKVKSDGTVEPVY